MGKIRGKLILSSVVIMFVTLLPLCSAKAESVQDYMNNLVVPNSQYSTMTSSAYLKTSTTNESVDSKTGSLKIMQTDYKLSGTNGLDLEIKRIYTNMNSNIHQMKARYENGVWIDYVSSDEETSSFYEDRYNLGVGERFSFPTIEVKKNSDESIYLFFHSENGDVYRIIKDGDNYSIEGHKAKDIIIKEDTSYTNKQSDGQSRYVVIEKDGKRTFFSEDGRILSIKDRYDNTIKFEYGTYTYTIDHYNRSRRLINKITDTVGRIVNIDYKEDQTYELDKLSGDLKGKFQVIIYLPDSTPNNLKDNKTIIYDKSSVLASNSSNHSIRERIQRVIGTDGKIKYHYWFENSSLGFTFGNENKYSVKNDYENLVQIDDYKSNSLKRYEYGTFTKTLDQKGSMQYNKITAVKELSKTGYDDNKASFLEKFAFDIKNVITYKYTNDPSGYGVTGYKKDDAIYLQNYRYCTEKKDSLGVTTKFTYNGTSQMIFKEESGKDHKEVISCLYDKNKFPSMNKKEIYSNGKLANTETENFVYDQYGNLTSYTGIDANRNSSGVPTDKEHSIDYTYDNH
jgi:hypothetical protein